MDSKSFFFEKIKKFNKFFNKKNPNETQQRLQN